MLQRKQKNKSYPTVEISGSYNAAIVGSGVNAGFTLNVNEGTSINGLVLNSPVNVQCAGTINACFAVEGSSIYADGSQPIQVYTVESLAQQLGWNKEGATTIDPSSNDTIVYLNASKTDCGKEGHTLSDRRKHTKCEYCGGYLCDGRSHGIRRCVRQPDCGIKDHYINNQRNHNIAGCFILGHWYCDGRLHDPADCFNGGHWKCDGRDHSAAACGIAGHRNCDGLNHNMCALCGARCCNGINHDVCEACGGRYCVGSHAMQPCQAHYVCGGDALTHTKCDYCSSSLCDGKAHSQADCNVHCTSEEGNHSRCPVCGGFMCNGSDHSPAKCGYEGHTVCDLEWHDACPYCGGFVCDGEDHDVCLGCGGYLCDGNNHEVYPCGHSVCANDGKDHEECPGCGGFLCDGKDHRTCGSAIPIPA